MVIVRFNDGRNSTGQTASMKYSNNPGKLYGLSFELFLGPSTGMNPFISSSGLHIVVENVSTTATTFEGFDISTGAQTNIVVQRTFSEKLGPPYNDCVEDLSDVSGYSTQMFKAS